MNLKVFEMLLTWLEEYLMEKKCVALLIPDDVDVSEVRNLLFEAIAETDEALMDKYFAGEEFTQEEIVKGYIKV